MEKDLTKLNTFKAIIEDFAEQYKEQRSKEVNNPLLDEWENFIKDNIDKERLIIVDSLQDVASRKPHCFSMRMNRSYLTHLYYIYLFHFKNIFKISYFLKGFIPISI